MHEEAKKRVEKINSIHFQDAKIRNENLINNCPFSPNIESKKSEYIGSSGKKILSKYYQLELLVLSILSIIVRNISTRNSLSIHKSIKIITEAEYLQKKSKVIIFILNGYKMDLKDINTNIF